MKKSKSKVEWQENYTHFLPFGGPGFFSMSLDSSRSLAIYGVAIAI